MLGHLNIKASHIAAAMLMISVTHAATITKVDYKAYKARIATEYKTDKAACDSLAGNAKDTCFEVAKAKEKVAKAELDYNYSGKFSDHTKVLVVRAKSAYKVAKQRCDEMIGNAKDVCVKEAKAAETKGLAEAKMEQQIRKAKKEAAADERDADYRVAVEKCRAMVGDAKANCFATATANFGNN